MKTPTRANLCARAIVDRRKANWPNAKNTGKQAGLLPWLPRGGGQPVSAHAVRVYNTLMVQMGWGEKVIK